MSIRTLFLKLAVACTAFLSIALAVSAQSLSSPAVEDDKVNVAVLTLKNAEGVTAGEAEIISDRLRAELFSTGKVNIMEREQMQSVLKEQGFQQSGACSDEACMVEIGKLLGVKQLVTGSIGKLGSIFLVNVRVIDVTTGKIIKVLSRDLNGMDVVVGHLPGISRELVGVDKAPATAGRGDIEARQSAVRPAPAPAQPATTPPPPVINDETKTEPTATLSDRDSKNRNRGGIHLGYNFYIGETWIYMDSLGKTDTLNYAVNSVTRRPVQQPNLNFIIPLGQYITMDVGAGFGYWREDFTGVRTGREQSALITRMNQKATGSLLNDSIYSLEVQHLCVPVMAGLNVVIRAYPVKFTFGPAFSYMPIWIFNFGYDKAGSNVNLVGPISTDFTYAMTLGGKAGIEILLGPHVGIGGDFLFRPSLVKPSYEFEGWTVTEKMPLFGAGANLNFYF